MPGEPFDAVIGLQAASLVGDGTSEPGGRRSFGDLRETVSAGKQRRAKMDREPSEGGGEHVDMCTRHAPIVDGPGHGPELRPRGGALDDPGTRTEIGPCGRGDDLFREDRRRHGGEVSQPVRRSKLDTVEPAANVGNVGEHRLDDHPAGVGEVDRQQTGHGPGDETRHRAHRTAGGCLCVAILTRTRRHR